MELAALQKELRSLIKGRASQGPSSDPYIRAVAQSPHLQIVREIALYWLAYSVEKTCPLTCNALKRRGNFDETIGAFIEHEVPPFIEDLASAFLVEQSGHLEPLVASVAQFERAILNVKRGDAGTYVIQWEHEPYSALASLMNAMPLLEPMPGAAYQTVVSGNLPDLFTVERLR
jgi:hypothetical protein